MPSAWAVVRSVILRVQASWVPCHLWSDCWRHFWPGPHGLLYSHFGRTAYVWGFKDPLYFRWSMLWILRSDPWNRGSLNCQKPINLQQTAVFLRRGTCKYTNANDVRDYTLVFSVSGHKLGSSFDGAGADSSTSVFWPGPTTLYTYVILPFLK